MKRLSLLSLIAVLVLTACATGGARHDDGLARGSDKLARYQPYVSEPVSQFNMYSSFDGWSDVDNEHVIIHTNVNESYLLTVAPVCIDSAVRHAHRRRVALPEYGEQRLRFPSCGTRERAASSRSVP